MKIINQYLEEQALNNNPLETEDYIQLRKTINNIIAILTKKVLQKSKYIKGNTLNYDKVPDEYKKTKDDTIINELLQKEVVEPAWKLLPKNWRIVEPKDSWTKKMFNLSREHPTYHSYALLIIKGKILSVLYFEYDHRYRGIEILYKIFAKNIEDLKDKEEFGDIKI